MARKVFISVLGSTNYGLCSYANENKFYQSSEVRFIQEATLGMLNAKDWSDEDIGFVCLTEGEKGSRKLNWEDGGHRDRESNKELEGLNSRINKLQLPFEIKGIIIKEGKNNNEIWDIFNDVYSLIKDDDEIYFDITHGFRYLPMLILVLSNYAKFLKNIQVKSITYGNYETRVNQEGVDVAPIIDLTDFSLLQDWTNASSLFVKTGGTELISNLIYEDNEKSSLDKFQYEILEVRGLDIHKGTNAKIAKEELEEINYPYPPFEEIKDKLLQNFTNYEENSLGNLYEAAKFCSKYNYTQQGVTILTELIISKTLETIGFGGTDNILNINYRNAVSGSLVLSKIERFNFSLYKEKVSEAEFEDIEIIVKKTFSLPYFKKLSKNLYIKLSQGSRNDINHSGFRDNAKSIGYFSERLERYLRIYEELFMSNITQ